MKPINSRLILVLALKDQEIPSETPLEMNTHDGDNARWLGIVACAGRDSTARFGDIVELSRFQVGADNGWWKTPEAAFSGMPIYLEATVFEDWLTGQTIESEPGQRVALLKDHQVVGIHGNIQSGEDYDPMRVAGTRILLRHRPVIETVSAAGIIIPDYELYLDATEIEENPQEARYQERVVSFGSGNCARQEVLNRNPYKESFTAYAKRKIDPVAQIVAVGPDVARLRQGRVPRVNEWAMVPDYKPTGQRDRVAVMKSTLTMANGDTMTSMYAEDLQFVFDGEPGRDAQWPS